MNADASRVEKKPLEGLLINWPKVCTDKLGHTGVIKHQIITTDPIPVRKKAYPVPMSKQQFIDDEVASMIARGIVRPSTSPWAAPVVLVPKKDGRMRFCVDYRALNAKTHLDGFPMPQIQDILESMYGASVFSTLDLRSGYWQVSMDDYSIHKTAFITKKGQYEFLRLPFGLKNAAAIFQRLMFTVLQDLIGQCCLVYIDDIVIYSKDVQEHLQNLKQVFVKLESAGLTLNLEKCSFLKRSLSFLGHVISGGRYQN